MVTPLKATPAPDDVSISMVEGNSGAVTAKIITKNLEFHSVTEAHFGYYVGLFGTQEVMKKFLYGAAFKKEETEECVIAWAKRWREGNPLSAFAVFEKATGAFVGHVLTREGDGPGEVTVGCIFHKVCWNKGYGSEAGHAFIKEYLPLLALMRVKSKNEHMHTLTATARVDNPASCAILERTGFKFLGVQEKFGAMRKHYALSLIKEPVSKL